MKEIQKWFLVVEGKVAEPDVDFPSLIDCLQWTRDNKEIGCGAQWINIVELVVEDEQS